VLAVFEAVDHMSNVIDKMTGRMGSKFSAVAGVITTAMTGAAGAAGQFLNTSINTASEFSDQVAVMSVAARDFGTSMGDLHDVALKVGGDTDLVGVSATGAADSITGLVKAGLSATEVFGDLDGYLAGTAELGGALRASIDLAAASELDMVQASDLAAIALATFGGELETEAERAEFVNAALNNFVQAADASVAEVSDLAAAMGNVGPVAAAFGFNVEDVNNALAILSTRGISGAEAGTALKSMFTNIMRPTDAVTEALDELNISLYDQSGQMRSLPEIVGQLSTALGGLTEEQRNQYAQTLAGTYGMRALHVLVGEGVEGWNDMAEATANAATIQDYAAARTATLSGKMEALEGAMETVSITVGEAFLPMLVEWAVAIAGFVEQHGPRLAEVAQIIAQWIGENVPRAVEMAINAWNGLQPTLETIVKIGGDVIDFVQTLHPETLALAGGIAGLAAVLPGIIAGISGLVTSFMALNPLLLAGAAAIVAVAAAFEMYKRAQDAVQEGTENAVAAADTWSDQAQEMLDKGATLDQVMLRLADKSNTVTDAWNSNVVTGTALGGLFGTHNALLEVLGKTEAEVQGIVTANVETYREYVETIDAYNASVEDASARVKAFTQAEYELATGTGAAAHEMRKLEEGYRTGASGLREFTIQQQMAAASSDEMVAAAESSDRAMLSYVNTVVGAREKTAELVEVTEELESAAMPLEDTLKVLEGKFADLELSEADMMAALTDVSLEMGLQSDASAKLASDVDLITSAFAEGTMSQEAFLNYAEQAKMGTLSLSDAQVQGIGSALEHARATREAAAAAEETRQKIEEYRLSLLSLSESLVEVGAQQAAQIALQGLKAQYDEGILSIDNYEAAVISVQDAYGLATPQSRALAEAMTSLNALLTAGVIAPQNYAAAVETMRTASAGGVADAQELIGMVAEIPGAAETAMGAVEGLSGAVESAATSNETAMGRINEHVAAVEGLIGGSDTLSGSVEGASGAVTGLSETEMAAIASTTDLHVQIGELDSKMSMASGTVAGFGSSLDGTIGTVNRAQGEVASLTSELQALTGQAWNVVVTITQQGSVPTPPGGSPPGMQTGAWNVPTNMMAFLHQGEMVLPTTFAAGLRAAAGERRSGDTYNYYLNYTGNRFDNGQGDAARQMREIETYSQVMR
jgi:TP901 family phage tail tape measure protein